MRSSSAAGTAGGGGGFAAASADFKLAAAVAGFGLLLQDSPFKGSTSYDDVVVWAEAGLARQRFVRRARSIPIGQTSSA